MTEAGPDAEPINFGLIGEAITQAGRQRTIPPSVLLCEEGRTTDCLFLVLSGELEVARTVAGTSCTLCKLGPGALVALMPAVDGAPSALSIRTLTEVTIAEVDAAGLLAMMEPGDGQNLAAAHEIARVAIRRLRRATDELAETLYEALVCEDAPGRANPVQMARIQAANHTWVLH